MRVDERRVAHLAGAQIVHVAHAGRRRQQRADLGGVGLVEGAVGQILQRVIAERPTHARHHETDDRRRDRVEQTHAGETADDADRDDERRRRIRARVPRIGDEHRRTHAPRLAQHVAEQRLLRYQHRHRDDQRGKMHGRNILEMHEPVARAP